MVTFNEKLHRNWNSLSPNTPCPQSVTPDPKNHPRYLLDIEGLKRARYVRQSVQNNGRNMMMMKAAANAVNQQKELKMPTTDESASTLEKRAGKLCKWVASTKPQVDNQRSIYPSSLLLLLSRTFDPFQTTPKAIGP